VAGSVYLLNDILDVESDRQHPEKCKRPIASGELPIAFARSALVVFMLGGILASFLLELRFGIVALAYLILQIAYCFRLKHIVLVDVFTIATGFVMRTVAGGLVISAPISHWLLLCSLLLALLLGFGKRRQEIVLLGEGVGKTRAILQEYSKPFLDQMIGLVAGVTIVCYSVYTIESDSAKLHPHLWMTVPFVLFSVCRYLYMVYEKGMGGAPEEVLRKDRHLQIGILLWFFMILFLFAYDKAGQPFLGIR
jgi:4-hydroxybenzoate polyprenyltransferase